MSRSIDFRTNNSSIETGELFCGELTKFIQNSKKNSKLYDCLLLDFCGSYKKNASCVEQLFAYRLINDAAVCILTFSYRHGRERSAYYHDEKMKAQNHIVTRYVIPLRM